MVMAAQNQNNKKVVTARLYDWCKARCSLVCCRPFHFNNDEVRAICAEVGFGNAFDVTKIDNSADLPDELIQDDVFIVHLGSRRRMGGRGSVGWHQFVSGLANGYHSFEPIPKECRYQWRYRRSMLNNINTSESNILSVGYNQRIIHDFLYEDITASPKVYGSNRTQIPLQYRIGRDQINARRVQVEIDFTMEYQGQITVFEAKNGTPVDFNVFSVVQSIPLLLARHREF